MPRVGETIHGYKFESGFGGKGANQCIAASKLNSKCCFVGKLGKDSWGESYKKHFIDDGVIVDNLEIVQEQVSFQ
jgi:ribokinase